MAILKGNCKTYKELFTILHNGMLSESWTVQNLENEQITIDQILANVKQDENFFYVDVIYKGIGFIVQNSPFVKIRYIYNTNIKQFGLLFSSMRSYSKNTQEVNIGNYWHYVSFDEQTLNYHICINQRRVVANFIQNIKTQNFYFGFFLPLMKPNEYQYPYFIGASQKMTLYNFTVRNYEFYHNLTDASLNGNFFYFHHDRYSSQHKHHGEIYLPTNQCVYVASLASASASFIHYISSSYQLVDIEARSVSNTIGNSDDSFMKNFTNVENLIMVERMYLTAGIENRYRSILGSLDGAFMLYQQ